MHRLRPRGRRQQRYTQLDNDVGFLDAQFERGEPKVPVRSIVLAVVLFIVGSVFLIVGTCLFTGVIDTKVVPLLARELTNAGFRMLFAVSMFMNSLPCTHICDAATARSTRTAGYRWPFLAD
eukprot:m.7699 g.7699  ORF g.7699 m.7699 type:complete len:122 (-) comp2790_c0_seq1:143-508(-)